MRRFFPLAAAPLALLSLLAGPKGSPTAVPSAEAAACAYAGAAADGETSRDRADGALRCLISNERQERGLNRLDRSKRLEEAAQRHSRDMHLREYFSHIGPGGRDVAGRVDAYTSYFEDSDSWKVGETLAARYGPSVTPREILATLMSSSSHRRTLFTRRFRHIGVGWTLGSPSGSDSGATVAVVLGDR